MIDIHSHIINDIDDGSKSLEESKTILRKMVSIGFTGVVATSHYITGSMFSCDNNIKLEKLNEIKLCLKEENNPLELYLGNEVFIDSNILALIKEDKVSTLNNSKYILIELPVKRMMHDAMDILFQIRSKGYVPILAHPERYVFLQDDNSLIDKFLEMGILFQGNLASIIGKYGKRAKKLFIKMLKNKQFQFLASDIHDENDVLFLKMDKVKKMIMKIITKEEFEELTRKNPLKIIYDEEIEVNLEPKKKKKLFG